jgi:hypothetical protein
MSIVVKLSKKKRNCVRLKREDGIRVTLDPRSEKERLLQRGNN